MGSKLNRLKYFSVTSESRSFITVHYFVGLVGVYGINS